MPRNGKGSGPAKGHPGGPGGPAWKPDKAATEGSYGQAVSDAARARPKPAMPEEGHGQAEPGRGKPRG